jgi:hypothetical protein
MDKVLEILTRVESILLQNDAPVTISNAEPEIHLSVEESDPLAKMFQDVKISYEEYLNIEKSRQPMILEEIFEKPMFSVIGVVGIVEAFQGTYNCWFPTMDYATIQLCCQAVVDRTQDTIDETAYLGYMILALGNAAHNDKKSSQYFFSYAYRSFAQILTSNSYYSLLGVIMNTLFFLYLQRPVQAWHHINIAAAKIHLMNVTGTHDSEATPERLRRCYWACFILESELAAKLRDLPQTCLTVLEPIMGLPGYMQSHSSEADSERATFFFLSCISIRKLLNRVRNSLYDSKLGVTMLVRVVAELDRQLEEWKEVLPEFLTSTDDDESTFLNLRYHSCKAATWRPILIKFLEGSPSELHKETLEIGTKVCINAFRTYLSCLRPVQQLVLVDSWTCSAYVYDIYRTVLVLLHINVTKGYLTGNIEIGKGIRRLFESCEQTLPSISPAVEVACGAVGKIDAYIEVGYADPGEPSPGLL